MTSREMAIRWHNKFSRFAGDLYPGLYTHDYCLELAEQALEIQCLAKEKRSTIMAHYYTRPEFHEIAHKIGDSLALSRFAKEQNTERVDFAAVAFMAETTAIITNGVTRVFISDSPRVLGCSLVFGTDHAWIENWKSQNPDGIVLSYINSDMYTKAISDFITTSRNTDKIMIYALKNFPGRKILFLPDKFLGRVMATKALAQLDTEGVRVDRNLIDIYEKPFGGFNACCYVHEKLGSDAIDIALIENPDAELMIHPECGCASTCYIKLQEGTIPHERAFFLSTEQMIQRARISPAKKFIVATEMGLIYALRSRVPDKKFIPVSVGDQLAQCDFMKANNFPNLIRSLIEDRIEIIICDNCHRCFDPKHPFQNDKSIHIPRQIADAAKKGINRMLEIQ